MSLAAIVLVFAFSGVAADPAGMISLKAEVSRAIEEFTPFWKPAGHELCGYRIGIDPAGRGESSAESPECADLDLLTAAYLYHHVRSAGGTPILTRAEDPGLAHVPPDDLARRRRIIRENGCHLAVSIRYAGASRTPCVIAGPEGATLASRLRSALDGEDGAGDQSTENDRRSIAFLAGRYAGHTSDIPVCAVRFGPGTHGPGTSGPTWKLCRGDARALYLGISRFCTQDLRNAASETGQDRDTTADTAAVPCIPPADVDARTRIIARSIWPEGPLPEHKVDWFCRMFERTAVINRSLVHPIASAFVADGGVVLRGATNAPPVPAALEEALRTVGIERVRNEIRSLPDYGKLGDTLFGACRVPTALTFDRPGEAGAVQTQLLFGEPVFMLDRAQGHYLLHAGDGYWGWAREGAVQPMSASPFDEYVRHPRGTVARDVHREGIRIPRGARVPVVGSGDGTRAILLPDGSQLTLPVASVTVDEGESERAAARARAALDLLYSPYVFGGRSALGLDCSGLVTNVWARSGGQAARDAWQQALTGSLVATRWHRQGIRPGDQVFFLDRTGRIYHTGVAINTTHVVHAAPPGVQIGSLDPGDRLYDPRLGRDFFMAKRP